MAGWLVLTVSDAVGSNPPQPPWTAAAALFVAAAGVAVLARTTHVRLQLKREWMDPHRAVSYLVLGKACALGGALVVGGYLVFGAHFLGRLDASAPRSRVIVSAVAVVAGIALTAAGLLLERACKVPKDPDEDAGRD